MEWNGWNEVDGMEQRIWKWNNTNLVDGMLPGFGTYTVTATKQRWSHPVAAARAR